MLSHSPALAALVLLLVALGGLAAGSVVNALADRVAGDEEPPWRGGECAACHKPLPATRLIPLAGWFLLDRRCPACDAPIAPRRPLVEAALALLFPVLLLHITQLRGPLLVAPWLLFVVDAVAVAILALIFVVDLEHHLILDLVVYPAAAALVLVALLADHKALASIVLGALVGGGMFLVFYGLGRAIYHEDALGFGDVKLAALIGMVVGWPGIIDAVFLAALIGAAIVMLLLGLGRATRTTFVPFGTFLSTGAILALFLAAPLWQ